jgi:gas vesicle protein
MNNNDQNNFSPLMAAFIGGVAGALVVYFSDDKRRKNLMNRIEEIVSEGEEKGTEFKDIIDKSIKIGRKNLAKKIRQVENTVAQT